MTDRTKLDFEKIINNWKLYQRSKVRKKMNEFLTSVCNFPEWGPIYNLKLRFLDREIKFTRQGGIQFVITIRVEDLLGFNQEADRISLNLGNGSVDIVFNSEATQQQALAALQHFAGEVVAEETPSFGQ